MEAGEPSIGVNCFGKSKGLTFGPNPSANLAGVESEAFVGKTKRLFATAIVSIILSAAPSTAFADTYYTVKPGDSLWRISRSSGTTVERIQELNGLNSTMIFPGQSLLVSKNRNEEPAVEVSRGTNRMDTILKYARSFTGVPYVSGGESPKGFDCSGYVQYVFKHFGVGVPRTAEGQFNAGRRVSTEDARPGDIVAFRTGSRISHTGIYLGDGKFISATSSSGVMVTSVYGPYWGEHLYGFSRIIP